MKFHGKKYIVFCVIAVMATLLTFSESGRHSHRYMFPDPYTFGLSLTRCAELFVIVWGGSHQGLFTKLFKKSSIERRQKR